MGESYTHVKVLSPDTDATVSYNLDYYILIIAS